jgi:hypothetical protein
MNPEARLHPSIPAIAFIIWWIVASVVFPDRMINADGDMLRHIRHGEEMLRTGGLIHFDPFSYTRGGDPFVGFEYGSQLVYALVHRAAGLAGVAIFAGLLIASAYALLARFLLARGVDALLTYLTGIAAAVLGSVHWSARPHLFTLVGVMLVLPLLEGPPRRDWRRMASAVLLFAVWANLHGGFVFGFVLLGIYFAGSVAEMLLARRRGEDPGDWRSRAVAYLALGLVGLAGTFLTPNGIALHRHIVGFFGERFLMDNTQEFLSPDFHSLVGKLLLLALLGVIALFALTRERPDLRRLFLVLALVYFSLDARRNIQLFGATVLPILAIQYDALWRRRPDWRGIGAVFERDAKLGRFLPYALVLAAAFAVIAAGRGQVAGLRIVPDALDPEEFPVEIVRRARADRVEGRIFHDFVWGGYMLYAWPEQKVFIDGGTDFYGPALLRTYMDVASLRPGWRDTLRARDVSLVLVAPTTTFAHEVLRQPGWRIRDCDGTAVLLEHEGTVLAEDPDVALDRCSAAEPAP